MRGAELQTAPQVHCVCTENTEFVLHRTVVLKKHECNSVLTVLQDSLEEIVSNAFFSSLVVDYNINVCLCTVTVAAGKLSFSWTTSGSSKILICQAGFTIGNFFHCLSYRK